jgi:hypothetical protein
MGAFADLRLSLENDKKFAKKDHLRPIRQENPIEGIGAEPYTVAEPGEIPPRASWQPIGMFRFRERRSQLPIGLG